MKIKWLWDNHIVGRVKRFFMTFYKYSFTFHAIDAYDKDGKCVFIGYSKMIDGVEYMRFIWMHQDLIDTGFLEDLEEDNE